MNRPKYEEKQIEIQKTEKIAKMIHSKSNLENEFVTSTIKNEKTEIQASLNTNGLKINSIKLLEFKTRENEDLKTIDETSQLQFSLYEEEKEINFNKFSKTKDGFYASNETINCLYSFSTDDKYKFNITIDIKNNTKEQINLHLKGIGGLKSPGKSVIANTNGKVLPIYSEPIQSSINWLLFPFDYWATYLLLPLKKSTLFNIDKQKLAFFESESISIPAGSSERISYSILSVPTKTELLKSYENEGIKKLNRGINYGIFGHIKIYLSNFLETLFSLTGNQVFALVLFIIVLKILTLYLDYIGFMAGSQIERIAQFAKFSPNPQLIQREIMQNLKFIIFGIGYKYIVKSFIFIIIYQLLSDSILFYKAPFLWIKDLSIADQISTSNLFGLANNNLWFIPKISILSIIIVFFFLDFKFNFKSLYEEGKFSVQIKAKGQNAQNIPIIFILLILFLFSTFPAIVSLYTVLNNSFDKLENYLFEKINET